MEITVMNIYILMVLFLGIFMVFLCLRSYYLYIQNSRKEKLKALLSGLKYVPILKNNQKVIDLKTKRVLYIEEQIATHGKKIELMTCLNKIILADNLKIKVRSNENIINAKMKVISNIEQQITDAIKKEEYLVKLSRLFMDYYQMLKVKEDKINILRNTFDKCNKIICNKVTCPIKKDHYNEIKNILITAINYKKQSIISKEEDRNNKQKILEDKTRQLVLLRNRSEKEQQGQSIWSTMKPDHLERISPWYNPTKYDH